MKRRKFFGLLGKIVAIATISQSLVSELFNEEAKLVTKKTSNDFEKELLEHLYKGKPISHGSLYIKLYKQKNEHKWFNPKLSEEDIEEVDYKGYKRIITPRDNKTWKVEGQFATNIKDIYFPLCTGGSNKIVAVAVSWEDRPEHNQIVKILSDPLYVSTGIQPYFTTDNLTFEYTEEI